MTPSQRCRPKLTSFSRQKIGGFGLRTTLNLQDLFSGFAELCISKILIGIFQDLQSCHKKKEELG